MTPLTALPVLVSQWGNIGIASVRRRQWGRQKSAIFSVGAMVTGLNKAMDTLADSDFMQRMVAPEDHSNWSDKGHPTVNNFNMQNHLHGVKDGHEAGHAFKKHVDKAGRVQKVKGHGT